MVVGNVVKLNCFELFEKGDEDLELESYSRKLNFISGMKDGLPIALGYISVAFAFGILALEKGFPIWAPILISATNFTGTGQFVGIDLIASYATLSEIAFTILIINLRYVLMSLSLSQKIVHNATLGERLLIAFGVTDEIFVVSMGKTQAVTFPYMMGLILSAYCGCGVGDCIGCSCQFRPADSCQKRIGNHALCDVYRHHRSPRQHFPSCLNCCPHRSDHELYVSMGARTQQYQQRMGDGDLWCRFVGCRRLLFPC